VDKVIENAKAIAIPQNRQILHVIPQEYIVDDQHGVQQPVGLSGLRLEVKVHIVTASVSMIKNLLNCINKAKLEVIGLALEPLVSSQSVLNKGDEDLGIIIIDMGGGTTDLAIYYDGSVRHTAVIGYGGENITNDLAVGIGTSKQEAERIKKEYGCSFRSIIYKKENIMINDFTPGNSREISLQVLNSIIEPRAEEILEFAYREYKKTDFHGLIAGGVILTGGGALLKGIENLTKQIFDMPVRIGNPHGIQGLENKISHPKFATGVGLLVNGYKTNGAFSNKEKYGAMEKVWQPIRNFFKDII
jgi:cell division protein FtsA